jgi:hypothetical protein
MFNLFDDINEMVLAYLKENAVEKSASEMNTDIRGGNCYYVGSNFIAIDTYNKRSFDYYCGGEYINSEYVKIMGDYVFYSDEASRIAGMLGSECDEDYDD